MPWSSFDQSRCTSVLYTFKSCRSANTAHIRAHIEYEQGRDHETLSWLEVWLADYDSKGLMHCHLWWHVALARLRLGDAGSALEALGRFVQTIRDVAPLPHGAARDLPTLCACAWISGAARWLVDATAEYVGVRRQFGQAIGQFQVVQHRAVDMHADTEAMHALLWSVASRPEDPVPTDAVDALVDVCWRYWRRISQSAVQLHGAIAMTCDLPVGAIVLHGESLLARHAQPMLRAARRAATFHTP